jgi:hypothetical protein
VIIERDAAECLRINLHFLDWSDSLTVQEQCFFQRSMCLFFCCIVEKDELNAASKGIKKVIDAKGEVVDSEEVCNEHAQLNESEKDKRQQLLRKRESLL